MRWQASIRTRLTAWYVFLLALILIVFSLVLYAALSDQLYRDVDDRLRLEAASIAAALTTDEIQQEGDDRRYAAVLSQSNLPLRLLDRSGRVAAASDHLRGATVEPAVLAESARQGGAFHAVILSDHMPARAFVAPLLHEGRVNGYVEVAESLTSVETALRNLSLILIVAVPATLALASLAGAFIANRALHPISVITREAQRIGEQELDRRLNLDLPDDEVGRLARTFDAMLARLDAAFRRQRQFTADASHELRTPLTVMKTNLGVTLNRPRSAGEYRTALSQIEGEIDRLTRLTDDLLLLARADSGRPLVHLRDIDAADLIRDAVNGLRPLAEAKSLTLNLAAPKTLVMRGDPDRLHRMLSNLIENAIKYTQRGSVDVRVVDAAHPGSQPPSIRITIGDTGPGIAPEHVPHLFERFYRIDESRSREQGGSGLGLAIAHSIAAAHGGTIQIDGQTEAGTTVVVSLPTG